MKIVIVGTAYPLRGGIAHYNALLAQHLSVRHTVETITFKRQYPSFLFPGRTQDESGEPPSVQAAPQLVDSINPLNWLRIGRLVARKKADLLIMKYWLPFFGPCFGTIASAARRAGTKVLFICDNVIPHERRPGDVLFTNYAFNRADYFLVQSDAVERELLKYFPHARYVKVPHPVYENFGRPIAKEEARRRLGLHAERVLLYFGYVRAYKGLHLLIDAMKIAGSTLGGADKLTALVVGEFYDGEESYRDHVGRLGLEESVRFVPEYVPNEKVGLYFSAADAVVLPYLSATQSGIAQIAYNFDKPLIVTDVGGLAEVVRDGVTGLVVPPADPQALASAMTAFYQPGNEERLVAGVQEEKKKYSWDRIVTGIEQLVGKT